jgi:cadmium resistance protein CadD (predicted permease)
MDGLIATLQLALAAGLATTFDDNIYLTGFFGELNRSFRAKHVIVGEILGFSSLVVVSLTAWILGRLLPTEWIGLLGILRS